MEEFLKKEFTKFFKFPGVQKCLEENDFDQIFEAWNRFRDAGITYIVIDGMVIAIDAVGNEDCIGKLEGESDEIQSLC